MKAKVNKVTIEIVQLDIISLDVEGIVNATDPNLTLPDELMESAGPSLEQELLLLGWCDVGSALITSAGNLRFKKIIHTVGPRWGEISARGKLANATWESLKLAEENGLKSIAMPPISTGVGGYPVENCAKTMISQIIDFTFELLKNLRTVIVCTNTENEFEAFQNEFRQQLETLRENGEGRINV